MLSFLKIQFNMTSTNKLFLDIETIPAKEKVKSTAVSLALQKAKKYGKKPQSASKEALYRLTAISGDFGQIFCIGYAINNGQVQMIKGSESVILKEWWQVAGKADLFVGHNVMDFDLRFIYKRSIINKIKPAEKHLNLSFARYRNFPIYDTMREWEKWSQNYISLDTLAKALDLQTSKSSGIDGSKVFDHYLKGKYKQIYDYCMRDVELTRKIYKRMTFID